MKEAEKEKEKEKEVASSYLLIRCSIFLRKPPVYAAINILKATSALNRLKIFFLFPIVYLKLFHLSFIFKFLPTVKRQITKKDFHNGIRYTSRAVQWVYNYPNMAIMNMLWSHNTAELEYVNRSLHARHKGPLCVEQCDVKYRAPIDGVFFLI